MASPDFGNTAFEGDIRPEVPILEPVQDDSELYAAQGDLLAAQGMAKGFDEIAQGVAASAPLFGAHFKAQAAAKNMGVLGSFQEEVLLIADAVEQGLSVPAARMRLRALNAQYVGDNPTLLKELNELQAQLTKTHGLADITTTGNEAFQRNKKLADDAVSNGWVGPDGDIQSGVAAMQAAQRSVHDLDEVKRRVEFKVQANLEVTEEDKFLATGAIKKFVLDSEPWLNAQIGNARKAIEGGAEAGAVITQLKETVGIEMQKVGSLKALGGEGDLSYMMSGVEKQLANFEEWAIGGKTTEIMEADLKRISAQNKLAIMSDPAIGPLISASELIGNTDPVLIMRISQESARLFGAGATKPTVNPDGTVSYEFKPPDVIGKEIDIAGYLVPLQDAVETSILSPTPKSNEEVNDHITNLLRSVKSYSSSTEDARDFRAVVEFFANPSVGKFAEQNKAIIPQNMKDEASFVIQEQYEKVLLPIVQRQWDKIELNIPVPTSNMPGSALVKPGTGATFMKPEEVIEPFWNGAGVEFRVIPGSGFENNASVQAAVDSLNTGDNSIANPLNTLIRAKAHMQGNTDYQKVYDEGLSQRLFGQEPVDGGVPVDGPKGDEAIDIDELAGGNIPLNLPEPPPVPEGMTFTPTTIEGKTGQLLDSIGQAEGADYETIYGYGETPQPITSMTLNELQVFQKDMVRANGISSAVGKYQILRTTMSDIIKGMGLKGDELFTPELQDQMAMWLLQNRTDYETWAQGRGDKLKFQDQLASIWASIPDQSGRSAYAGDGVNNSSKAGSRLIGLL